MLIENASAKQMPSPAAAAQLKGSTAGAELS
jgi:hypothetical protein